MVSAPTIAAPRTHTCGGEPSGNLRVQGPLAGAVHPDAQWQGFANVATRIGLASLPATTIGARAAARS